MWNYVGSSDHLLGNSLFGAVKLMKNADIDKYKYSGYGTGFDMEGTFRFSAIGFGRNVIIFGADMISSERIDNKKIDILILGKDPKQRLDGTSLPAEKIYSINFSEHNKKFCLSPH